MTAADLRGRVAGFKLASPDQQLRMTAQLLNSLLPSNEAAILFDEGGVLTEEGVFSPEVVKIIEGLEARPHPPVTFISGRMV
ncbi:hypothetical protein KC217_21385, partial [Mycobacterium tuberculosis]|nr:hypothetical protein [Mycobacterium tuberculosis]